MEIPNCLQRAHSRGFPLALPSLRAMDSLQKFVAFVSQHYFRHHMFDWPDVRITVEVALGDLDAAKKTRDENLAFWSTDHPGVDADGREKYRRMRELCARIDADDRGGLAELLHEWEAATVKNLNIEKLWQPTPFPLEQQAEQSRA
jgi:hypothetical protein